MAGKPAKKGGKKGGGTWVTMSGGPVFIKAGQTAKQAAAERFGGKSAPAAAPKANKSAKAEKAPKPKVEKTPKAKSESPKPKSAKPKSAGKEAKRVNFPSNFIKTKHTKPEDAAKAKAYADKKMEKYKSDNPKKPQWKLKKEHNSFMVEYLRRASSAREGRAKGRAVRASDEARMQKLNLTHT